MKTLLYLPAILTFCIQTYSVPLCFNYQGYFSDSLNRPEPIKDSLKFSLFNLPSGGACLWSETHFVNSSNGFFSLILGSRITIIPSVMNENDSLFLEIARGQTKGTRLKINSVMFALRSATADSAGYANHADSSRFADSASRCNRSRTADIADSARAAGNSYWQGNETLCYRNQGNVAIGTDSGQEKLTVRGNFILENPSGNTDLFVHAAANPSLTFRSIRGSGLVNRAKMVYANNALYLNLWDTSGATEIPGAIIFRNEGNVIDAKGAIRASSFKVGNITLNVPDYVFEPDYNLCPLNQLENYIKENRHLPGIPSAKEVDTNGLDLAEMNLQLLKKVEELTLYILEQNKKLNQLKDRLDDPNNGSR